MQYWVLGVLGSTREDEVPEVEKAEEMCRRPPLAEDNVLGCRRECLECFSIAEKEIPETMQFRENSTASCGWRRV